MFVFLFLSVSSYLMLLHYIFFIEAYSEENNNFLGNFFTPYPEFRKRREKGKIRGKGVSRKKRVYLEKIWIIFQDLGIFIIFRGARQTNWEGAEKCYSHHRIP